MKTNVKRDPIYAKDVDKSKKKFARKKNKLAKKYSR